MIQGPPHEAPEPSPAPLVQVLAATARTGKDGRLYYDVAIRMTSYASRNPYVTTQAEVSGRGGSRPFARDSREGSRKESQMCWDTAAAWMSQ